MTVPLALLVTFLGFLIYWGLPQPSVAISFAIGAAGPRSDTASARAAWAGSLALLVTPALLGGFADKVGLHLAHLIVPGLVVAALIRFVVGQVLPSQAKLHQSG